MSLKTRGSHSQSRRNASQYARAQFFACTCAFVALVIAGLLPAMAAAPATNGVPELRALITDESDATQQIVTALRRRYPRILVRSDPAAISARHGKSILLAIGPAALDAALDARVQGPVVALFASAQEFDRIARPAHRGQLTAIYAEASPVAQLQLIAKLYRRPVTVAVLETPVAASALVSLRTAALAYDLSLAPIQIAENDNILRALARSAPFDVLLIQPDRRLSQDGIRGLLEATYRRQQGAVGFSVALVKAGMLAAPFASLDDTLAHLDEVIETIARTGNVPTPQYPRYWRAAINESVARSLGIVVDDSARLLRNIPPGSVQ